MNLLYYIDQYTRWLQFSTFTAGFQILLVSLKATITDNDKTFTLTTIIVFRSLLEFLEVMCRNRLECQKMHTRVYIRAVTCQRRPQVVEEISRSEVDSGPGQSSTLARPGFQFQDKNYRCDNTLAWFFLNETFSPISQSEASIRIELPTQIRKKWL